MRMNERERKNQKAKIAQRIYAQECFYFSLSLARRRRLIFASSTKGRMPELFSGEREQNSVFVRARDCDVFRGSAAAAASSFKGIFI
jgi:hypothetical protein